MKIKRSVHVFVRKWFEYLFSLKRSDFEFNVDYVWIHKRNKLNWNARPRHSRFESNIFFVLSLKFHHLDVYIYKIVIGVVFSSSLLFWYFVVFSWKIGFRRISLKRHRSYISDLFDHSFSFLNFRYLIHTWKRKEKKNTLNLIFLRKMRLKYERKKIVHNQNKRM